MDKYVFNGLICVVKCVLIILLVKLE